MEHGIGVDAVVLCVAAAGGIHPAFVIALLPEQVVEIEGYDKSLAFQETLGELTIPYKLVGVHRRVVISSTAVFVDVCAEFKTKRKSQEQLTAIAEPPSVEVGIGLQLVTCMLIVEVCIE